MVARAVLWAELHQGRRRRWRDAVQLRRRRSLSLPAESGGTPVLSAALPDGCRRVGPGERQLRRRHWSGRRREVASPRWPAGVAWRSVLLDGEHVDAQRQYVDRRAVRTFDLHQISSKLLIRVPRIRANRLDSSKLLSQSREELCLVRR